MSKIGSYMNSVEHIVFISPGFPVNGSDDTCIPPFQAYLKQFKKQFPDIVLEVIALYYPKKQSTYYWEGVKVYALNGNRYGKLGKIALWFTIQKLLGRIHQDLSINLIHSLWLNDATLYAQRFCRKNQIQLIATIMGQDALPTNWYLKLIDYSVVTVIAISSKAASQFEETTQKKVAGIIPWGIEESIKGNNKQSEVKDVDVIAVGSLIEIKNYDLWLQVIHEIVQEGIDINCVIIGIGKKEKSVRSKIRRLKLKDHVALYGQQSRSMVLRTMDKAKVLLHTASYEGQGYVFLEALAKGLPVVCRDVGFLPSSELVHICRNKNEMVQSVKEILNQPIDPQPQIALNIRDTVHGYWKIYIQKA